MEGKISFRAVIEVVGKPQEHVEKSITQYIEKLKADKEFIVDDVQLAEVKKQENQEFWATFAELEASTEKINSLAKFCFEYMPSIIEITQPKQITFDDGQFTHFLNDLQARLHQVDMVAKTIRLEHNNMMANTASLLRNYITLLLRNKKRTSKELSQLTGVSVDDLEDFMDGMIDQGKVDLKEEYYGLIDDGTKQEKS